MRAMNLSCDVVRGDARRRSAAWMLAMAAGLASVAVGQPVSTSWLAPTSGSWSNAANWSGGVVPENGVPAGAVYDVTLGASASLYTVGLNSFQSVRNLTINSSNAVLSHTMRSLTIGENFQLIAGTYSLNGAGLVGGTFTRTGGTVTWSVSGVNVFNGVTLVGTFDPGTGSRALLLQSCVVNGSIRSASGNVLSLFQGVTGSGEITVDSAGVLQVQGSQTIGVANLRLGLANTFATQPLVRATPGTPGTIVTIGSGTLLEGRGLISQLTQLVNEGTVRSSVAGRVLEITPSVVVNNGVMESTAGTLIIAPVGAAMSGTGTLRLAGGSIRLGGPVTVATIDSVQRVAPGGGVELSGTLNLEGSTWSPTAMAAPLSTTGGARIVGGVLDLRGTLTDRLNIGSSTTFDGVTVLGVLRLATSSSGLNALGTTRFEGGVVLSDENASLQAAGINQFTGGQVRGRGRISTSGTAVIASGVTVKAQGGQLRLGGGAAAGVSGTVTNSGVLTADSGAVLTIEPQAFNHNGTIIVPTGAQVRAGAAQTVWTGSGGIELAGGSLAIDGVYTGGLFSQFSRSGGTLTLAGEMNLEGGTTVASAFAGPVQLSGQWTLSNGVFDASAGSGIAFSPVGSGASLKLRNASLLGQVSGVPLFLEGTCRVGTVQLPSLAPPSLLFRLDGSTNLVSGTIQSPEGIQTRIEGPSGVTLTIGTNAALKGSFQTAGNLPSLINRGRISAGQSEGIFLVLENFLNTGTVEATQGGAVQVTSTQSAQLVLGGTLASLGFGSRVQFTNPWVNINGAQIVTTEGGDVSFTGGVDLAGQTLVASLDQRIRSVRYRNGTVNFPTVAAPDDFELLDSADSFGVGFSQVTINGDAYCRGGVSWEDGTIVNGTMRVRSGNFSGSVGGTGTIVPLEVLDGVGSVFGVSPGGVTIGPGLTMKNPTSRVMRFVENNNPLQSVLNFQGTLLADASNQPIEFRVWSVNFTGRARVGPGRIVFVAMQNVTPGQPSVEGPVQFNGLFEIGDRGAIEVTGSNATFSFNHVMKFKPKPFPPTNSDGVLFSGSPVRGHLVVEWPSGEQEWALWPIGMRRSLVRTSLFNSPTIQFSSITLPNASSPTLPGGRKFVIETRLENGSRIADLVVVPACTSLANVAGPNQSSTPDEALTADDIIVFLGWFFTGDLRADVAGANQATAVDGELTADDIIVFLNRYFGGCP